MALETNHSIEKGVRRLLGAPRDLHDEIPDQGEERPLAGASHAHQQLYRQYVADFATAYEIAGDWWEECVDAFLADGSSRPKAVELAYDKRAAGPASAPEVVWFVRTYWLSFEEINRGVSPAERIPPQFAMLGWLLEEKRTDYVRLLTCMPYWPVGLDENGNWC